MLNPLSVCLDSKKCFDVALDFIAQVFGNLGKPLAALAPGLPRYNVAFPHPWACLTHRRIITQGVALAIRCAILDASPKGGTQMEAIDMTDTQLRDAASYDMTFEYAVEIILRGGFSDALSQAAWREYDDVMQEEELLLQQWEAA